MLKSVLVRHKWHVNCCGWKTWEVEAETEKELEYKILKIKDENRDRFYSTGFEEIKILPSQTHKMPSGVKLTLKERFLGYVLFERKAKQ